jgi:hypothetical protein
MTWVKRSIGAGRMGMLVASCLTFGLPLCGQEGSGVPQGLRHPGLQPMTALLKLPVAKSRAQGPHDPRGNSRADNDLRSSSGAIPRHGEAHAFAWPQVLLFHGSELAAPVAIAGVDQVMLFMNSLEAEKSLTSELTGRQAYAVAVFWSPSLRACSREPECVRRLRPEDAEQGALYYPASGSQAAEFVWPVAATSPVFGGVRPQRGRIGERGLTMLADRGIPLAEGEGGRLP